jgi:signal transduction histidine kinase
MRRRLTVAILVLIAVTLVVTTIGSYFFIRRAAVSTTQQELAGQARAISTTFSDSNVSKLTFRRELNVIAKAGAFEGVGFIRLEPAGTYRGTMPAGITIGELDVPALRAGRQVTGHTGALLAYSAVPTPTTVVTGFVPILVITRQIPNPANGLRYFLLVGVVALAVAALVAAALGRRFTRSLVAAVATTSRIAAGDLDATMAVGRREDPEFAQLAESINAMGANLVRARDQERQFLLSVSHELRTPLTSIRGYADAVIDGTADDPFAAATVISTESRRLERLVQDLLDLARLDADRFSLELQRVDAAAVTGQVVESFRPRAEELGLELDTAPGSGRTLWVEADADRLAQVLANLVENAASFAHRTITVGAGAVGGTPTLWVVDDGPGILPDQLPRVFERHFTSDRAGGRRKGSGLGLAIVSELAAAMGAGVRAESPVAAGGGARMLIWFRAAPVPPPATPGWDVPAAPRHPGGPGPTGSAAGPPVATAAPVPSPAPPIPGGSDG